MGERNSCCVSFYHFVLLRKSEFQSKGLVEAESAAFHSPWVWCDAGRGGQAADFQHIPEYIGCVTSLSRVVCDITLSCGRWCVATYAHTLLVPHVFSLPTLLHGTLKFNFL